MSALGQTAKATVPPSGSVQRIMASHCFRVAPLKAAGSLSARWCPVRHEPVRARRVAWE